MVVYLITSPLSKRDYERFGVQRWLERKWKVKVFDFTKLLKPKYWDYVNGDKLKIDFDGLKIFEDEKSALASIEALEEGTLFVDFLQSSRAEQKIRKAAQRKGVTLKCKLGTLPTALTNFSFKLFRIIQIILKHPKMVFPAILNFFRKYQEVQPNYWIVGGSASNMKFPKDNPSLIKAHNFDYDFFLTDNKPDVEIDEDGVVFLDGDEAYHADYVHLNIRPYVTSEKYFPTMNNGLCKIAKELRCDTKIAAHPRSNYKSKPCKYSLPILKDQTFDLIKRARVVVSHGSSSLQWAIIMRKPIILVTTEEMRKSLVNHLTEGFANTLGKEVLNLDRFPSKYDWKSELFVDESKYKNYIETYIKQSGTPEKLLWDIVIDRMENDFFMLKNCRKISINLV